MKMSPFVDSASKDGSRMKKERNNFVVCAAAMLHCIFCAVGFFSFSPSCTMYVYSTLFLSRAVYSSIKSCLTRAYREV